MNPVALLFDTLMQPNQDTGETHPPSLGWSLEPRRAVSHVVLGRGEAGGSWHRMHPDVKSLSPWRWLQLPIYGFDDWLKEEGVEEEEEEEEEVEESGRVRLGSVARYYHHYIKKMEIANHFRSNVTVTQAHLLRPKSKKERRSQSCESTFSFASSTSGSESEQTTSISSPDGEPVFSPYFSPPAVTADTRDEVGKREGEEEEVSSDTELEIPAVCDSDDTGISCCTKRACLSSSKYRWVVRGRTVDEDGHESCLCVSAQNVVLATGVNDSPKKLGVPGEDLGYVRHSFSDISPEDRGRDRQVMVVGAGLAAADAVLHTLSQGHKVLHIFHQDTSDQKLLYHTMDPGTYSEYVTLFQKMSGKIRDPHYTPLSRHRVRRFSDDGVCTVCDLRDSGDKTFAVSLALVLIGGRAQLDFLPECITQQMGLNPDQPIDAKHNPMDLDPYTFESEHFPSLFALGPLAGDNFVRFVVGGALGITKKLQERSLK